MKELPNLTPTPIKEALDKLEDDTMYLVLRNDGVIINRSSFYIKETEAFTHVYLPYDEKEKWISTNERLPDVDKRVLFCDLEYDKHECYSGSMDEYNQWWYQFESHQGDSSPVFVTHWQPLPEPPKSI